MKSLVIISNEKFFLDENNYYCDNLDMKSTPEELSNFNDILLICRKFSIKRAFKVDQNKIKLSLNSNIFSFLISIFKTLKIKNDYLVFSLTPYTFLSILFLSIFRKNIFVYLRSDGYEEYYSKLGISGKIIYGIIFNISSVLTNMISCSKKILRGKKGEIVFPSQLNSKWFIKNNNKIDFEPKLLYVGRIKKEKGVFSLIDIIKKDNSISLTIVGATEEKELVAEANNIKILKLETNIEKLIDLYDNHSIFILPSFTEGHPMVLLESLARHKPVIVFDDLSHIVGQYKGVFLCKRNINSLRNCINHINKNYFDIIELISTNKLPTKKEFIMSLEKAISKK